jgi:hypothetical protein
MSMGVSNMVNVTICFESDPSFTWGSETKVIDSHGSGDFRTDGTHSGNLVDDSVVVQLSWL